ncbi:ADAMTS-like protein 1 isoform X2 [Hyla sarda]|uniref:ADAMTS-like protein 1 isoform X2 n=1 Tax=Hyla sarda TaxID=327740 RepID=UPI0024C2840F|nr:ADAMTS-like protein 1 isoform X2 [Hyla sarda]
MASPGGPHARIKMTPVIFLIISSLLYAPSQVFSDHAQGAVFLHEFPLIRRENHQDEFLADLMNTHKIEDPSSRTARSEEDRDTLWDAWGSWSECSRTCGGGASYSLRRCLSSKSCEGRNIRYRTCSNVDCPAESGDFRAQQCSAHNDVKYQGQYREWLPVHNDPENPCSLKCQAKGTSLIVELAPKVLDGTRCYTESLDMCISGLCQIVGCDHQLGSTAKEDNCGVCNGEGSTCRLVRGQYKSQLSASKLDDTVVVIPYGSRHIRLVLKGPDHLYLETKTLQGVKGENGLSSTGLFLVDNTTVDFQRFPDKEILRIAGPLSADFSVKVRYAGAADSVVQFIFYQPIIHRWRETDFFPCSASCGGGYQLTSAECYDMRSGRVVADQYCHYYPENVKPKPRLQECNMDPCLASDGYKQIMPYDLYHPLPRWENTPWTACSSSCGGGIQSRTVSCVEEDMQGQISSVEEWKCMYTPKMPLVQPCNIFDCPKWLAQEWSPCTVTCGHGLRYRVVLCIDHRGIHTGGCSPKTKPHIKEECTVPIPCFKIKEKLPVEAKLPWYKQAQELEEATAVSEEPSFIPEPWSPCSVSCGIGVQHRSVKCQVLLSFAQTVADLPIDECEGPQPVTQRTCYSGSCNGEAVEFNPDEEELENGGLKDIDELYDWEYEGFSECSESCGGGMQEAVVVCLNKQTRSTVVESLCVANRRPPPLLKSCNMEACPPRWEVGNWSSCSLTCGVGLQTRDVFCSHLLSRETNETVVLGDDFCKQPKPTLVQACNRFDCPPAWYPAEWKPCSQSCGGGIHTRDVLCKQRLSDGSILELPDTFCSSTKPIQQEMCENEDCPPEWYLTEWSKCSVSCGEGTQIQSAVCRKKVKTGEYVVVNSSICAGSVLHPMARPCLLAPCTRSRNGQKTNPHITGLRKLYIQTRKQKKLQFVVGGYAYLLAKTTLVLKCPVRRFRKPQIIWEKDGKHLISSEHITVAPHGYIKIHHLRSSDTGVYTCMAGPSQEHFVIKLIGESNKIISQDSRIRDDESIKKIRKNEAYNRPEKQHTANLSNRSKTEKQIQVSDASCRYDNIIARLLALKPWAEYYVDPSDPQESFERNISSDEDHVVEHSLANTVVIDIKRVDDIIQSLSQQPVELHDNNSRHLLNQLAHELARNYVENHEAPVFKAEHKPVSPGRSEHSFYKPVSGFSSSWRSSSLESEVFEPHEILPDHSLRKPVILRKISAAQHFSASEVVTHIGQTVALASGTLSVLLHCEAGGNPKPVISWARNGEEVKYSNRILLKPDDSLEILEPVEADVGFYTCNATNSLGSASVSIAITLAGKPLIKTSRTVLINMDVPSIAVDVGSVVKTIHATNVTIHCQVAGLPEADVTWYRNNSRLHHVPRHSDTSLFIGNITYSDQGQYTCKAVNIHGEVSESTQLQIIDPPLDTFGTERVGMLFAEIGPKTPSVLTSLTGNKLLVNTGGSALIGCPVKGDSIPYITWIHGGQPLNTGTKLTYDILEGGQILQLINLTMDHQGEYSCVIQRNPSDSLTQKAFLSLQDYQWALFGHLPCTTSCGNRGIQHPQLRCVLDKQEVNVSHCQEKPKPPMNPIACNRRDCPPRWMVTSWSTCSQSCGGGVQTRRVTCQKMTGGGISVPVSNDICIWSAKRPVDSQSCSRQLCVEWATSSWGQCHGPCIGPRTAVQHRQVYCQTRDGAIVSPEQCQVLPRPLSTQNCLADMCSVQWRVSSWTLCTATCGSYGFQSRRVECVHHRTGKSVQDHMCSWRPRPSNWQRCNIAPCENGMSCKGWIY